MHQSTNVKKSYLSIVVDFVSIVCAYIAACVISSQGHLAIWNNQLECTGFILAVLVYLLVIVLMDQFDTFFRRGCFREFGFVCKTNLIVAGITSVLLFFTQQSVMYSRSFFLIFFLSAVVFMYVLRLGYKKLIGLYFSDQKHKIKLLIATTKDRIEEEYDRLSQMLPIEYEIIGISVLDADLRGRNYQGTPIVSNGEDLYEFARTNAVDEVFISLPGYPATKLDSIILTLEHMGIVVNLNIMTFGLYPKEKRIKQFGGYHVLTYSTKVFDQPSLILKRGMDIVGACVGLLLTGLAAILVVPAIKLESKGPAVFSQVRIGKNGRRFKIYKFRSMYPDAEQRKKELMQKNEMNGLMFKMSDDPRITKVGKFIRETSLDELPQFFNVLRGDMSLVGTRPPTEDEFLQYENTHKRRLSLKPGITGLWQVSGRSDITDFEEVVRLDLEYIDHWSFINDIKILFKTVFVVFGKIGSK